MTEIIERRGGTVIQFQGDAILATFNVPVADPEHARQAVRAALEMRAETRRPSAAAHGLACRIGIGTGAVVAGAVGASGRLSYTVYGDAVNLAARLEALNREHGTAVLLCGETAAAAEDLPIEPAGTTTVRGQSVPTRLFTVREDPPPPANVNLITYQAQPGRVGLPRSQSFPGSRASLPAHGARAHRSSELAAGWKPALPGGRSATPGPLRDPG